MQIRKLLSASKPYQSLRMRILLALGTGVRRGDIESLSVPDIDFENNYVTTRSKKTRKSMGSRPVAVPIMGELRKYVSGLNPEQEKLFGDRFNQYRWNKIRDKLGLGDFKFHDLRKTFGSVLAQNGVSTAVIQRLLEHSSPDLTNKVYTNVDPALRQAVDIIPVGDWLWANHIVSAGMLTHEILAKGALIKRRMLRRAGGDEKTMMGGGCNHRFPSFFIRAVGRLP